MPLQDVPSAAQSEKLAAVSVEAVEVLVPVPVAVCAKCTLLSAQNVAKKHECLSSPVATSPCTAQIVSRTSAAEAAGNPVN